MRCGGRVVLLACLVAVGLCRPGQAAPGASLLPGPKATVGWWPAGVLPDTGRHSHQMLSFGGRLWVIGGVYPGQTYISTLSSANGEDWTIEQPNAPWGVRQGHACVIFQEKIWLFGGTDEGQQARYADGWSSPDGVNWTNEISFADWAPRTEMSAVVHDGKIWIMGGNGDRAWPQKHLPISMMSGRPQTGGIGRWKRRRPIGSPGPFSGSSRLGRTWCSWADSATRCR